MPDNDKKTPQPEPEKGKVGVDEKKLGAETTMPGATNPKVQQSETRPPTGEPTDLKQSVQRETRDGPKTTNETQEEMRRKQENEQAKQREEQRKAFQERSRDDKKKLDEMIENLTSYQASAEFDELEQVEKDRVTRQLKAMKEVTDLMRQRITTFVTN